jgi:hypothetical protein
METLDIIFMLLGTFLPLIGAGLTVILANIFKGNIRWTILFGLPALTMLLCWVWASIIWQDGNMLAAALFFIYLASLIIYYPVLIVSGLIIAKNNKKTALSTHSED